MNRPNSRKIARRVLGVAVSLLLAEGFGWLALGFEGARWVSWERAGQVRRQVVESGGALGTEAESRALDRSLERARGVFSENVLHPFLGFVSKPVELKRWAGKSHPEAANLGFPTNTRSLLQSPGENRLVVGVFGGSVAQIFASGGRRAFIDGLAELPRFAGKDIVLLNLALGGMKQPQQLMTLNYLLALGGHLDVVINIDGFNEVALPPVELVPRGIAPFYPRDWYYRLLPLEPEARAIQGEVVYLRKLRLRRAQRLSRSLRKLSALMNLAWQVRDRLLQRRMEEVLRQVQKGGRTARGFQARGPEWPASDESPVSEEELHRELAALWLRSSQAMFDLSTSRGIEYYHFLQPNQYLEGSKILSAEELEHAFNPRKPLRRGVVKGYPELQRLGEEAASEGFPFHDLTAVFGEVHETLYLDDCCHFNLEGNRIMAQRILGVLRSEPPG